MSCVHIDHLGTLLQQELRRDQEPGPSVDLAERLAQAARDLSRDLRKHGARSSNARIATPRLIQLDNQLLSRWAEDCVLMYKTATTIGSGLPRTAQYIRVLDLVERVTRRASDIHGDLMQLGAKPAGVLHP
jgi:hypothetical protein